MMSITVRSIIISISFLLYLQIAQAQEPQQSALLWFKSFFNEKNNSRPLEDLQRQAEIKLDIARENQDMPSKIKAFKELGLINLTRTNDYSLAMEYFIKSLAIEDSLLIKDQQVFTYVAIAKVFEKIGDYIKSADFLNKALLIHEQYKDINTLVFLLNEQGKINALTGRLEEAFENYESALKYKDQVNEPGVEAEVLFNLAHLYSMQNKYSEALSYHKNALSIRRTIRDKINEAQSLNDIGELYALMKNDAKALANHLIALRIRRGLKDKKGMAESYNKLGILYYRQKNYQLAIDNLQLARQQAEESHTQDEIQLSYEYLSQCYKELDDYKNALKFKEFYQGINDLLQNEKHDLDLIETQNRYDIQNKELQIVKLEEVTAAREKEIEEQKDFRNFLFIVIGLSLVIVLLMLSLYFIKQRSNKVLQAVNEKVHQQNIELQNVNATKDKFFSIISHDLKGPLNSLTSFSGLLINHTESLSKEEIQMMAKDLDKSIKNLFALLENLLEWSRSQTGNIEFTPEVFDIAEVLTENKTLLQAQAQQKRITLLTNHNDKLLVNAHRHSINTVVRNLISNAIKFTPANGTIFLNLERSNNEAVIAISDTGVGMGTDTIQKLFRIDTKHSTKGTDNEKGTGLGLILCKEFVEKNGGRIWITSDEGKGSVFSFTTPTAPENTASI